jgi:hypothetical protein
MAERPAESPYVGPRPFTRADRQNFRGRERELRELLSLVVANRMVLVYAASGAGKTSLLNAGLTPLLEVEEGFEVVPPGRIGGAAVHDTLPSGVANVYAFGLIASWSRGASPPPPDTTLAGYLRGLDRGADSDGLAVPRAVVIDQLEELFTLYPDRWDQREAFVDQVADALTDDPLLRVVLAIREDRLAELDAYAERIPGRLAARYRLERLGPEAALKAVVEPLDGTGRSFAPGVAVKLVGDLRTFRVDTGSGESRPVLGEFVEPVQLQVVCRSLWEGLSDVTEITEHDLRTSGGVDHVLAEFYDDAVRDAARAGRVRERLLREWLESALITSIGTRGTQHRAAALAARVPSGATAELVNRHLLRAEWRAGSEWYELTHDRLIAPIRASNARVRAVAARRRFRFAGAGAAAAVAVAVGVLLVSLAAGNAARPRAAPLSATIVTTSPATIKSPGNGRQYVRGSIVHAVYFCSPTGRSVVTRCTGTVPNGQRIDTKTLGRHTFEATASDANAPSNTQTVSYAVVRYLTDTYAGRAFSIDYPAGWRIENADADEGSFTDTTIASPASPATTLVRVDVTPNPGSASLRQEDGSLIAGVRRQRGYRQVRLAYGKLAGRTALYWDFLIPAAGIEVREEDVFFLDSASRQSFALLTRAPASRYASFAGEFSAVRRSIRNITGSAPSRRGPSSSQSLLNLTGPTGATGATGPAGATGSGGRSGATGGSGSGGGSGATGGSGSARP